MQEIGIVGASGQFGSALARLLIEYGVRVVGIGRSPAAGRLQDLPGYSHHVTPPGQDGMGEVGDELCEILARLDGLILSTPIHTLPALVERYGSRLASGALLCDLGSVKTPVEKAMLDLGRDDIELLSVHPLFAPVLPFRGQNVAFVPTRAGLRAHALLDVFTREGANLVEMSASEHDSIMAFSQGLSHALVTALGRVALRRGIGLSRLVRLSTPFNRCLLLLLGRIASFDASLYSEIQVANPLHKELLDEAIHELADLRQMLERGDRKPVTGFMASPYYAFEAGARDIHEAAHALFTVLPDPTCDNPPDIEPEPQDIAPPGFRRVGFIDDRAGSGRKALERFIRLYSRDAEARALDNADQAIAAIGDSLDAVLVPVETSVRADLSDAHDVETVAREGLRYFAEIVFAGEGDTRVRHVAIAQRDQPAAGPARTSVLVELEKDRPGALYRMLAPFAIRKINLTRIVSSPSRRILGEYYFQLDFLGSRLQSHVLGALNDARRMGNIWVLGSYPVEK